MAGEKSGKTIVIGDVHGELAGLREVLIRAGMADAQDQWTGGAATVVQIGDVIDRGRHSKACMGLLGSLQQQAGKTGGRVVRLCGNHELLVLQREYWFVNKVRDDIGDVNSFRRSLEAEVADGKLLAAWTDGTWLYTHAGLRPALQDQLLDEMGGMIQPGGKGLAELVDNVNGLFSINMEREDLASHPIFHVSKGRGGRGVVGGIFWADWSEILPDPAASCVPQIFGHTPSPDGRFMHDPGHCLINVDGGMSTYYGGKRTYLEIAGGRVVQHLKKANVWNEDKLAGGNSYKSASDDDFDCQTL